MSKISSAQVLQLSVKVLVSGVPIEVTGSMTGESDGVRDLARVTVMLEISNFLFPNPLSVLLKRMRLVPGGSVSE